MDEYKFDNIEYRINFINNLLKGKKVLSMVNLNENDTECFENPNKENNIKNLIDKQYFDFTKVMTEMSNSLDYINSGSSGIVFKSTYNIEENNEICYSVKVVTYPKRENYGNINDTKRPENAELMMLRLLSYFVINKQTPHIVLPICTFNTNIDTFINLYKTKKITTKKYAQFYKKYKQNEYENEVSVLIAEWANSSDLLDYFRNNYKNLSLKEWRIIFFQILSVLSVIHKKYPNFRHNDMKANNILVQKIDNRKKNNIFHYQIDNNSFFIPNIGIQIKLWDFDFACIPGIVENSKVNAEWTNNLNIKPIRNQYYDIHYFFNTLTRRSFLPDFWKEPNISPLVKEFVNRVIPEHLCTGSSVTERGRILDNIEYTTPLKLLLEDEFFDKIRDKK
jgi:serine/threonine protein kinase